MDVHGEEPADVAADIICLNCDRPAISKINGTAGHGHDRHPCVRGVMLRFLMLISPRDTIIVSLAYVFILFLFHYVLQVVVRKSTTHFYGKHIAPKVQQLHVKRKYSITTGFDGLL